MKGLKGLKIAISGGAGFLGSHLVEKALKAEAEIFVLDNMRFGNKLEHLRGARNLHITEGDVRDAPTVAHFLGGNDILFHLAALVGVEETQADPLETLDVEIRGTWTALEAAARCHIKRVVFASSSEVYGDQPDPMKEESPVIPRSAYAAAKLAGEAYCKAYFQRHGLEYVCLRYFNVYGPRQDERAVLPCFVKRALSNQPPIICGDGSQQRDFTYVEDAVNMTFLAALLPEAKGEVINIGTGIVTSIEELAATIWKAAGKNPPHPAYQEYDQRRPREVEVYHRVADTAEAKRILQYQHNIPLPLGVKMYLDWYLKSKQCGK